MQALMISSFYIIIRKKIDFKTIKIMNEWEDKFILIRGLVHQKDKLTIHVHTPNNRALKFTKQN